MFHAFRTELALDGYGARFEPNECRVYISQIVLEFANAIQYRPTRQRTHIVRISRRIGASSPVCFGPRWATFTDDETVAFEQYRDELMRALWPRIDLLLAAAALLWWPMDWVVYADRPSAIADFARLRATIIAINTTAFFYSKTAIAKCWTIPSLNLLIILESFVAGYAIRSFGGLIDVTTEGRQDWTFSFFTDDTYSARC